ncbi:hypothetical protein M885DRAFT_567299 [Pelagophyceae sp. CCMP2097]|nr:hypothetical protein M885DRAFT_567299 [Pelagophyceae sp. CCMP2097]
MEAQGPPPHLGVEARGVALPPARRLHRGGGACAPAMATLRCDYERLGAWLSLNVLLPRAAGFDALRAAFVDEHAFAHEDDDRLDGAQLVLSAPGRDVDGLGATANVFEVLEAGAAVSVAWQSSLKDAADACVHRGAHAEALALYGEALNATCVTTRRVSLHNRRALCFFELGLYHEAHSECTRSLLLVPGPGNPHALLRRAHARCALERWDDAVADAARALWAGASRAVRLEVAGICARTRAHGGLARAVDEDEMGALRDARAAIAACRRAEVDEARAGGRGVDWCGAADEVYDEKFCDDVVARLDEVAFNIAGRRPAKGLRAFDAAARDLFRLFCLDALAELHYRRRRHAAAADVFGALLLDASLLIEHAKAWWDDTIILDDRLWPADESPARAVAELRQRARIGCAAALSRSRSAEAGAVSALLSAALADARAVSSAVAHVGVAAAAVGVLMLHGRGDGADMASTEDAAFAHAEALHGHLRTRGLSAHVVAAVPAADGAAGGWYDARRSRRRAANDPFIDESLLGAVASVYAVACDVRRSAGHIFLVGFGEGGVAAAVSAVAAHASPGAEPFCGAAVLGAAPECGALQFAYRFAAPLAEPRKPLPLLFCVGAEDAICPAVRKAAAAAGGACEFIEYAGLGHAISDDEVYDVATFIHRTLARHTSPGDWVR